MAIEKGTIIEHTEPMLTEGEIVEKYAHAAANYNAMASACQFAGVPETLRDALYATRHGEEDIRTAANGCVGWWYVEVDSKIGEPRKLYVGVWPGGFEVLP